MDYDGRDHRPPHYPDGPHYQYPQQTYVAAETGGERLEGVAPLREDLEVRLRDAGPADLEAGQELGDGVAGHEVGRVHDADPHLLPRAGQRQHLVLEDDAQRQQTDDLGDGPELRDLLRAEALAMVAAYDETATKTKPRKNLRKNSRE